MTRIESELHDLYECLMRNDDMADRDTYHTIVGIANDVAKVEAENAKLRELVREIWRSCPVDEDDCAKCPHRIEESDEDWCDIPFLMEELGVEVD